MDNKIQIRSTTILCVTKDGRTTIGGDGQVTMGNTVIKHNASKISRLYHDKILTGVAGATADALTLRELFSGKLEEFNGNLLRASVELAKDWRNDKYLRKLNALMIVADRTGILTISGNGDVVEPEDGIAAIGSGGPYALAAARALKKFASISSDEMVKESLKIAGEICIYTNQNIKIETLS